jgi:hypothetical protein
MTHVDCANFTSGALVSYLSFDVGYLDWGFSLLSLVPPNIYWGLGFEVLTAVIINIVIFWDIAPCNPYVIRRFGELITSIFRVENQLNKKSEF